MSLHGFSLGSSRISKISTSSFRYAYDLTGECIELDKSPCVKSNNVAIEFFSRRKEKTIFANVFMIGLGTNTDSNFSILVREDACDRYEIRFKDINGKQSDVCRISIPEGPHQVKIKYSKKYLEVYINGQLKKTINVLNMGKIDITSFPIYIGHDPDKNKPQFSGRIENLMIDSA